MVRVSRNGASGGRRNEPSVVYGYWFDCETRYLPYDEFVKMSMIALKHLLGESIELRSKGSWAHHWGAGHDWHGEPPKRTPGGAVDVYEHIFPGQAQVQNVLSSEGIGF